MDSSLESHLIGATLARAELFHVLDLRPEDFLNAQWRASWCAVNTCLQRGEDADLVSVSDELRKTGHASPTDMDLLDLVGRYRDWPEDLLAQYASAMREESAKRGLRMLAAEITTAVDHGDDVSSIASMVRERLGELESRQAGGPVRIGDALGGVIDELEARALGKVGLAVSSGIHEVDRRFGQFRPGQLIVVAARPGMGKTSLVRSIAVKAADAGTPVLLFTLETTIAETTEAILSAAHGIPAIKLAKGKLEREDFAQLLADAPGVSRAPIWIDDRVLTAPQISSTARTWFARQRAKIGLVMVDYLGLIKAADKSETRALEVGRMAWAMKVLAKDIACPVILVSQLNRASEREQRRPGLADLRDSGEIEQHAHAVLFPYRAKGPDGNDAGSGPASLIVAKNRTGETGDIPLFWHADTMMYTD